MVVGRMVGVGRLGGFGEEGRGEYLRLCACELPVVNCRD